MVRSRLTTAFLSGLVCSLVSCATGGGAGDSDAPDIAISVGEQNARIGDQMFSIGNTSALRAALGGACASGCGYVEIQPTPAASYTAVRAVYEAARRSGADRLGVRFAWKPTVGTLRTGKMATEGPCPTELVGVENAMYVYTDGDVLPPSTECNDWSATVCRLESEGSARYDWSGLAELARTHASNFERGVCIDLRGDTASSVLERVIATVDESIGGRATYVLTTGKKAARLPDDAIAKTVSSASGELTACFQNAERASATIGVMIRFVIHSDGSVARAGVVDSNGSSPSVEACLVDVVKALRFQAPTNGGNVVVNYPLNFTPQQ